MLFATFWSVSAHAETGSPRQPCQRTQPPASARPPRCGRGRGAPTCGAERLSPGSERLAAAFRVTNRGQGARPEEGTARAVRPGGGHARGAGGHSRPAAALQARAGGAGGPDPPHPTPRRSSPRPQGPAPPVAALKMAAALGRLLRTAVSE